MPMRLTSKELLAPTLESKKLSLRELSTLITKRVNLYPSMICKMCTSKPMPLRTKGLSSAAARLGRFERGLAVNASRFATYESDNWSDADNRWSNASSAPEEEEDQGLSRTLSEDSKKRLYAWQARMSPSARNGTRRVPDKPMSMAWVPRSRNDDYSMGATDSPVHLHIHHVSPSGETGERLTLSVDDLLQATFEVSEQHGVGITERFEVTRRGAADAEEDEIVHRQVSFSTESARVEGRERVHTAGDAMAVRALIAEAASRAGLHSDAELINSLRNLEREGNSNALLTATVTSLANLATDTTTANEARMLSVV